MVDSSEDLGEESSAPLHDIVVASPEILVEGSGSCHNSPNWFSDMTSSYQVCMLYSAQDFISLST